MKPLTDAELKEIEEVCAAQVCWVQPPGEPLSYMVPVNNDHFNASATRIAAFVARKQIKALEWVLGQGKASDNVWDLRPKIRERIAQIRARGATK